MQIKLFDILDLRSSSYWRMIEHLMKVPSRLESSCLFLMEQGQMMISSSNMGFALGKYNSLLALWPRFISEAMTTTNRVVLCLARARSSTLVTTSLALLKGLVCGFCNLVIIVFSKNENSNPVKSNIDEKLTLSRKIFAAQGIPDRFFDFEAPDKNLRFIFYC